MKTDIIENLPGEEWRPIKGYENLYCVSNKGRVKSLGNGGTFNSSEHLLKPGLSAGYFQVGLSKNGNHKNYLVHRLVADTFISNPYNLPMINHKDENKLNNCVSNLEFCTNQYNMAYSYGNKIKCLDLKTNEVSYYSSLHETARQLNIQDSAIRYSMRKSKSPYKNRYIFTEA